MGEEDIIQSTLFTSQNLQHLDLNTLTGHGRQAKHHTLVALQTFGSGIRNPAILLIRYQKNSGNRVTTHHKCPVAHGSQHHFQFYTCLIPHHAFNIGRRTVQALKIRVSW